ncbi:MAG TPA: hypothetical protein VGS41_07765, partial [Chthonomonadales bacterium]|nr:hypothetical protein [Chthonomonadales bacterium]
MLDGRLRKNLDLPLLGFTLLVAASGLIVLCSASRGEESPFPAKQLIWMSIGAAALMLAAATDYHRIAA